MKKFLLSLVTAVAFGFPAFAEVATVSIGSSSGYGNAEAITEIKADDYITLSFTQGSNSNAPKYYISGTSLRMYGGNTMTVKAAATCTITELVISGSDSSNKINANSTVINNSGSDNGNLTISGTSATWTGESNDITFTQGGTSDHARINSIKITYTKSDDPRTAVTLSYPEAEYTLNVDNKDTFENPVLTCTPEEALSSVVYESSNLNVAVVNTDGVVTILTSGHTTITASIPEDNENYYGQAASYDLEITSNSASQTVVDADFFDYKVATYALKSKVDTTTGDETTGIQYSAVYYYNNGLQMNPRNNSYKGSGIAVTRTNPDYNIKSITIDYKSGTNGLNVFKKDSKFTVSAVNTAISTTGATQVNTSAVTSDETFEINAPAFAIIPVNNSTVINSITVIYEALSEDAGEPFICEAFHDYMICEEESVELDLGADAPNVTFVSTNEAVAVVEGNTIKAVGPGFTTIAAAWDAVDGKWRAGSEVFTVNVKWKDLATVLANVEEGQTYVGNFPIIVVSDNGNYNYVTDEGRTAWALFNIDHEHGDGSVLPAGWSGIYTTENGVPEFTNIKHDELEDYTVDVKLNEYSDIEITESMANEVLVLLDVTIKEATPFDQSGFTAIFNGKEYLFYNQFSKESLEPGSYNVKGVVDIDPDNGLEIFPIEYYDLEATTAVAHVDAELKEGDVIKFTGLEEGAHIYYRFGGEEPDHTNVFVEAAAAPRKVADRNNEWTYNHTTHPLTYDGQPMQVKYYAKAPGKAPSAVNELNVDENGSTTGIENIAVDAANGAVEYFNLQGIRVANPENGVFIRRQGNDVKKVIL